MYQGQVDADLYVRGSLTKPMISGGMQFSRGIAYLSQDATATSATAVQFPNPEGPANQSVCFKSMKIKLGPEIRAVYPFVLNFKLAGELELNGPADFSSATSLQPSGVIVFESGEINLVATQVRENVDCEKGEAWWARSSWRSSRA
jgi:hypothetical protein